MNQGKEDPLTVEKIQQIPAAVENSNNTSMYPWMAHVVPGHSGHLIRPSKDPPRQVTEYPRGPSDYPAMDRIRPQHMNLQGNDPRHNYRPSLMPGLVVGQLPEPKISTKGSIPPMDIRTSAMSQAQAYSRYIQQQQQNDMIQMQQALRRSVMHDAHLKRERHNKPPSDSSALNSGKVRKERVSDKSMPSGYNAIPNDTYSGNIKSEVGLSKSTSLSSSLQPRKHRPSVSNDVTSHNSVSPASQKSHTENNTETYSPPLDLSFHKKRSASAVPVDQPLDLSVKRRRKEKEDSDDDVILVGVQTVQSHPQPSSVSPKQYKHGLQRFGTPGATSLNNDSYSTAHDAPFHNRKEHHSYGPRSQNTTTNATFPAVHDQSRRTQVPYYKSHHLDSNAQKSEHMAQRESRMDTHHMKSTYPHVVPLTWGNNTKCSTSDMNHMPKSAASMPSKTYDRSTYSHQHGSRPRSPATNIVHHTMERPPTIAHIEKIPNIYSSENQLMFKENPPPKHHSQGTFPSKVHHNQHGISGFPSHCRDNASQQQPGANKQEHVPKSVPEKSRYPKYKPPKDYMSQMSTNSVGSSRQLNMEKTKTEIKGPYYGERDYSRSDISFSKSMFAAKEEIHCPKSVNYMSTGEPFKLSTPEVDERKYFAPPTSGCSSGIGQTPPAGCPKNSMRPGTHQVEHKQEVFNTVPGVPKHIVSVQGNSLYPHTKAEVNKGAIISHENNLPYAEKGIHQHRDLKSFDKVEVCQTGQRDHMSNVHQPREHDVKQFAQSNAMTYNDQTSASSAKVEVALDTDLKMSEVGQINEVKCAAQDIKPLQVAENISQVPSNPNMVSKTESKFHTNPAPKLIPVANVHPILKSKSDVHPKDEGSKEKVEVVHKKDDVNLELSTSVMEVFKQTLDATPQKIQITPNPLFSSHQDEFVRFLSRTKTDKKTFQNLNKKQLSSFLEKHGMKKMEDSALYKTPESSNDLGANTFCGATSECELERVRRNLALHFTTPKGRHKLLAKQSADIVDDVPLSSATEVLPVLQDKTLFTVKEATKNNMGRQVGGEGQDATGDSHALLTHEASLESSEQKIIKRRKRKPKDPEKGKKPRKQKEPGAKWKKNTQKDNEKMTAKERRKNYFTRKKPNDEAGKSSSSPHKRTWRKDGRPKLASRLRRALRSSRSSSKYDKNAAYEAELRKEEERRMLRRVRRRGRTEPEAELALDDVLESDDTLVSDIIPMKEDEYVVSPPTVIDHYVFDEANNSVESISGFGPTTVAHADSLCTKSFNDDSAPEKTKKKEKRKAKKMLKEKTSKRGPRVKKPLTKRRQKLIKPLEVAYEGVSHDDIFPNPLMTSPTIVPMKDVPPPTKTKVKRYPMQRVRRRHKRERRSLLKSEASLDKNDKKRLFVCRETGETTLHKAARKGYVEVALHCLDSGELDVNVRDNAGYTPLHESCVSGNLPIAKALIDRGADPNIKALDGTRPLHDAVDNNHVEHARLLLSHGADPTIANYAGRTPLKMARSTNMKNFLNDYFADMREESDSWEIPAFVGKQGRELGFDILDGAPSDSEKEAEADIFFDMSSEPHPASICLQMDKDSGYRNYHLVSEIAPLVGVDNTDDFLLLNGDLRFAEVNKDDLLKQLELDDPLMISGDVISKVKATTQDVISVVEINDTLCHLLEVSRERISASDLALEQWFLGPLGFSSRVNKPGSDVDVIEQGVFGIGRNSRVISKPTIGGIRKVAKPPIDNTTQLTTPTKSTPIKPSTKTSSVPSPRKDGHVMNADHLSVAGTSSGKCKQQRGTAKDKSSTTGIRKSKSCTSLKNMLPICSQAGNLSRSGSSPNVHSNVGMKPNQTKASKSGAVCCDPNKAESVKTGNTGAKKEDKPKIPQTNSLPVCQYPNMYMDKFFDMPHKIKKNSKTSDPSKVKKTRPTTPRKGTFKNQKTCSPPETQRVSEVLDHVTPKKPQAVTVEAGGSVNEPALPVLEEHTKNQQTQASEESSVEEEREMPELTLCAY